MSETMTNHDEHCPYKVERDALRAKLAAAEAALKNIDNEIQYRGSTPTETVYARILDRIRALSPKGDQL